MGPSFASLIASMAAAATEQSAQWNSADKDADITLSNGDRDCSTTNSGSVRSLLGRSSGKYYYEVLITNYTGGSTRVGFADSAFTVTNNYPGGAGNSAGISSSSNTVSGWTKAQTGTFTVALNDVLGFAMDRAAGYGWVSRNGVWQLSGDPAAGTTPWITGLSGTIYPCAGYAGATSVAYRINTKASELAYSPPSGFSAWAAA